MGLLSHVKFRFFGFFAMSKTSDVNIQIDHIHARAICDEIGDRLRYVLRRETAELPGYLKHLVARLAELDGEIVLATAPSEVAPSIIPSLEEMIAGGKLIDSCQENAAA
jgi:hypothetical protein